MRIAQFQPNFRFEKNMCSFVSVSVGKKLQLYSGVFWWRWWQSRCPGYVTGRSPGGGKLEAQLVGRVLLQRTFSADQTSRDFSGPAKLDLFWDSNYICRFSVQWGGDLWGGGRCCSEGQCSIVLSRLLQCSCWSCCCCCCCYLLVSKATCINTQSVFSFHIGEVSQLKLSVWVQVSSCSCDLSCLTSYNDKRGGREGGRAPSTKQLFCLQKLLSFT